MDAHDQYRLLEAETVGQVTVIRIREKALSNQTAILALDAELTRLVDSPEVRHVLLDLAAVETVSSLMLSKFIRLSKQVEKKDGKLVLCQLQRRVYELFAITKLKSMFAIKAGVDEGLASLGSDDPR